MYHLATTEVQHQNVLTKRTRRGTWYVLLLAVCCILIKGRPAACFVLYALCTGLMRLVVSGFVSALVSLHPCIAGFLVAAEDQPAAGAQEALRLYLQEHNPQSAVQLLLLERSPPQQRGKAAGAEHGVAPQRHRRE